MTAYHPIFDEDFTHKPTHSVLHPHDEEESNLSLIESNLDDTSLAPHEERLRAKQNASRILELSDTLRLLEKRLRKRTTSCLKRHELVKDFHVYKGKLQEQRLEKLHLFEQRELFSTQQEIEKIKVEHKKAKLEHYRLQQMYLKKAHIKEWFPLS